MRVSLGARSAVAAARADACRRACARRASGCRRSPAAGATPAAGGRAPAAAGSRGRRTGARPTARRSGSAVASSVRLVQPNQFASSSSPLTRTSVEARAARAARCELAGREGVHVDDALQRRVGARPPSAGGAARAPIARRHSGATRARRALGHARQAVAVARGLAGEQHACRPGRARARTRRTPARRSGMWCSTAWPSTRSKLSSANGSRSASAGSVLHLEAEPLRVGAQRREHPGRDVAARRLADHARRAAGSA